MESISFTELAKTPKPFVARGLSQGEFVRDLFIHISKLEGSEGSFFSKADSMLSQYYFIGMFEIYNEPESRSWLLSTRLANMLSRKRFLERC